MRTTRQNQRCTTSHPHEGHRTVAWDWDPERGMGNEQRHPEMSVFEGVPGQMQDAVTCCIPTRPPPLNPLLHRLNRLQYSQASGAPAYLRLRPPPPPPFAAARPPFPVPPSVRLTCVGGFISKVQH